MNAALLLLVLGQFIGPNGGMDSLPSRKRPDFSFTAPPAGGYATLTAATGQTLTCARASSTTVLTSPSALANVASGVCAVDYRGLQVEGASTNLVLRSEAFDNASWAKSAGVVAVPTVTADQTPAPDGNTTADQIAYPTVVGASAFSEVSQGFTATAATYTLSVWLKRASGTSTVYLSTTPDGATWGRTACAVSTTWTRCSTSRTLTAATWFFVLGVDLRDASQATQAAQTIFAWGAQAELQPFATSYDATAGTSVARAADNVSFAKPGNVSITGTKVYSAATVVQAEGVVANARTLGSNANFAPVFSLSSGTNNIAAFSDTTGGASQLTFADSSKTSSQRYQMHANGTKLFACAAGTCDATGYTLLTQPAEPTTLFLGSQDGTQFFLFGWISAACVAASATGCAP